MKVTIDGKNLVSHAGTALLTELADRSGLTGAMSDLHRRVSPREHPFDTRQSALHLGEW
jgi:hypothetical protein